MPLFMKAFWALTLIITLTGFPSSTQAGDGVIDLTEPLYGYASQAVPAYINANGTKDNTQGNPITDRGATLGRVLFYDKRLSRNDTISCASCHIQANAFSDTAIASTGVAGTTGRHAMRLINARFSVEQKFFWDERAATLENQTTRPIQDHGEMGFSGTSGDPSLADLLVKLAALKEYQVLFKLAFGDTAITEDRMQKALSQFVRSIQSFDSRYDTGRAQAPNDGADFSNFTDAENRGKQLFLNPPGPQGGAGCAGCHRPPEFDIDPNSGNNGIIASLAGGTDLTNTRSPTLRDLVGPGGQSHGPFMHDGSRATLLDVINHYNQITANNTNLDNRLRRPGNELQNLNLTQNQKSDLVAFLMTLTGTNVYTDPKWSNPFDAGDELAVIVLPANSMKIEDNHNGTVSVSSEAAPGLSYKLQTSTDLQIWSDVDSVSPDGAGLLQQSVSISGSRFYRFICEL